MKEKYFSRNENILLIALFGLVAASVRYPACLYILAFFIPLMIITGNIPRIYIAGHKDAGRLIRRVLYEIPLFVPAFFWRAGFGFGVKEMVFSICFVLIISVNYFIRRRDYRLTMSYDLLRLEKEDSYFQYVSKAVQLFAAVIGEELFFRGFLFEVTDYSPFMIPVGAFLFMTYHFGNSRGDSFRLIDLITQLCFGLLAGVSILITHSVVPGAVGHLLLNMPYIINECKKIRLKKEKRFIES